MRVEKIDKIIYRKKYINKGKIIDYIGTEVNKESNGRQYEVYSLKLNARNGDIILNDFTDNFKEFKTVKNIAYRILKGLGYHYKIFTKYKKKYNFIKLSGWLEIEYIYDVDDDYSEHEDEKYKMAFKFNGNDYYLGNAFPINGDGYFNASLGVSNNTCLYLRISENGDAVRVAFNR